METAALKAASDNRNKVFVRKVAAVYTPATLEAGTAADVGAVASAAGDSGAAGGGAEEMAAGAPACLMCLSEEGAGLGRGAPRYDRLRSAALKRDPCIKSAALAPLCANMPFEDAFDRHSHRNITYSITCR